MVAVKSTRSGASEGRHSYTTAALTTGQVLPAADTDAVRSAGAAVHRRPGGALFCEAVIPDSHEIPVARTLFQREINERLGGNDANLESAIESREARRVLLAWLKLESACTGSDKRAADGPFGASRAFYSSLLNKILSREIQEHVGAKSCTDEELLNSRETRALARELTRLARMAGEAAGGSLPAAPSRGKGSAAELMQSPTNVLEVQTLRKDLAEILGCQAPSVDAIFRNTEARKTYRALLQCEVNNLAGSRSARVSRGAAHAPLASVESGMKTGLILETYHCDMIEALEGKPLTYENILAVPRAREALRQSLSWHQQAGVEALTMIAGMPGSVHRGGHDASGLATGAVETVRQQILALELREALGGKPPTMANISECPPARSAFLRHVLARHGIEAPI